MWNAEEGIVSSGNPEPFAYVVWMKSLSIKVIKMRKKFVNDDDDNDDKKKKKETKNKEKKKK